MPACPLGYTDEQLRELLGCRYPEFERWMVGQTRGICEGRRPRDPATVPCAETPHGPVTYPWDVDEFLRGGPPLD